MKLIAALLVLLIVLGVGEMVRHLWHLRRVPIRVHVNGSRGKSSVTRLIAAGLRGGGLRTVAKTTGSAASLIHPDGCEEPVRRRGGPNIREQVGIVRRAVREGADALVIECMAIRPDLQKVCEDRIVRATHGVITNVRPDHLEIMGPTLAEAAANLAGTVPRRGHLLTAEATFAPLLQERAVRAGSRFSAVEAGDVMAAEMEGFSYVEFPENVALALATCAAAGVAREQALAGMWRVRPDVGALTRKRVRMGGKKLEFINAFAANDPVSYVRIWERLGLRDHPERVIVVMNNRADRQRRAKDLAPLLGRELPARLFVLCGEQTGLLADMLRRQGLPRAQLLDLGGRRAEQVWRTLVERAPERSVVVGIGNIARLGNELLAVVDRAEVSA